MAGDEPHTFLGSLERQRRTFAWKVDGLGADALNARVGVSDLSLAKLLKHLAHMEDINFTEGFAGERLPAPWDAWDRAADPDWLWRSAEDDSPEELLDLWRAAVTRSRSVVDRALAAGDMGSAGSYRTQDGGPVSLRRLVTDMLEEYARHVGHADIIRESIDGQVGEDPPETFPNL